MSQSQPTTQFGRVLIIGGTGMLTEATKSIAKRAAEVVLVARSPERLAAEINGVSIPFNWTQGSTDSTHQSVLQKLHESNQSADGFDLMISWVHDSGFWCIPLFESLLRTNGRSIRIHSSEVGDPSAGVKSDRPKPRLDIRRQNVVLGWIMTNTTSDIVDPPLILDENRRWLTNGEISAGCLKAVEQSDKESFIVGQIQQNQSTTQITVMDSSTPSPSLKSFSTTLSSLYRDAVESICSFLTLIEFVCLCRVNGTFYTIGRTMKARKDTLKYSTACRERPIDHLIQSPLRRHIANLTCSSDTYVLTSLIRDQMDHLEVLDVTLVFEKNQWSELSFIPVCDLPLPPHLRELSVVFYLKAPIGSFRLEPFQTWMTECMQQIADQSTRLLKLHLSIINFPGYVNCFHPLRAIRTLTEISLPKSCHVNQQIDLIKLLPLVRRFTPTSFKGWTTLSLQYLADGPIPSQLEDLGPIGESLSEVDEKMANQLRRLTALTNLDLRFVILSDPTTLLPFLPRLSILHLSCNSNPDLLTQALATCVSLTSLKLQHMYLTSDHFSLFLPHMVRLVELILNVCYGLLSLEFLTTAKTSLTHLRRFEIIASPQLPLHEFDHLYAISSSLEYLTICNSSLGPIDQLIFARWTPDSDQFRRDDWPAFKKFTLNHIGDNWNLPIGRKN